LINDWAVEKPKTRLFDALLQKISPNSKKILVVSDTFSNDVSLAARNLPYAKVSTSSNLSAIDIFQADKIIFSESGLDSIISKYNKDKPS